MLCLLIFFRHALIEEINSTVVIVLPSLVLYRPYTSSHIMFQKVLFRELGCAFAMKEPEMKRVFV